MACSNLINNWTAWLSRDMCIG